MRTLITGGTGLLGKALIEAKDPSREVICTYLGDYEMQDTVKVKYRKLDVRDKDGYENLFNDFKPEIVIHMAGLGSPDYVEKNKQEGWEINVIGTQNIIDNCNKFNAKLIYVSSNGIYDGDKAPYDEEDKATPINYYGQLKLEGENITNRAKIPHGIVRPILMYGWNHSFERPNVVTIALSKLQKNKEFFAYDDVYTNPLYVNSCAEVIWKIIDEGKFETFNIAGKDKLSVYELLMKATEIFNLDPRLLKPVKQGFFNEFTRRPRDTSYKTEKMERVLGIKPVSIYEGLKLMKESTPETV